MCFNINDSSSLNSHLLFPYRGYAFMYVCMYLCMYVCMYVFKFEMESILFINYLHMLAVSNYVVVWASSRIYLL